MRILFALAAVLFIAGTSAAQLPKLEERLDSLYLTTDYGVGEKIIRSELEKSYPDSMRAWLKLELGIFTQELGKYSDAEASYLESEKLFASSPIAVASVLSHQSVLYYEQGRFDDAKNAAEKQFSVYANSYGNEHSYTAIAAVFLATQLIASGNVDSSRILLDKYKPIVLKIFGEKSKEASRLYYAEGKIALAEKKYPKAEEYFLSARKTAFYNPGDKHPLTARISLDLARSRLILGNIDSAMASVNDALSVTEKAHGPSHPFTAECIVTKGSVEEANGKIPDAFASYQKALGIYKEATKENFRYTSERERLAFIRTVSDELSRLSSASLRTSVIYPQGSGLAYDALLFQKGIVLSSLQAMRRSAISSGDTLTERLLDRLAQVRSRRLRLISGQAKINKPFIGIDSLSEIANSIEKELARRSQAFRNLQALRNTSWKDFKKTQGKNAFIEISRFPYYVSERKTDTSFYAALILRPDDSSHPHPHLALIGTSELLEDNSLLRQYFHSLEKHPEKKNAALISKLLWLPDPSLLVGTDEIIIAPDGIYHEVSIPALYDERNNPLLEKYRVTIVHSTSDILDTMREDSLQSIAIFADPDYSGTSFPPLPGTLKEAEEIDKSFRDAGWNSTSFLKSEATGKNLKSIHHPSILHIATHGTFSAPRANDEEQLENSLLGSELHFSDGAMTALEAMDLDLEGTDLVTLSACESGKGIIQPGEGAFGLARAFRTAGAKNILMTLWSVPDKETKELMSNFYKNLLKHQSKSEALRSAQLAERSIVRKRYGGDIPYFWAGFVLIGF